MVVWRSATSAASSARTARMQRLGLRRLDFHVVAVEVEPRSLVADSDALDRARPGRAGGVRSISSLPSGL